MQKLLNNKKLLIVLFLSIFGVLALVLIFLASMLFKPYNSKTNSDAQTAVSYSVSYPISYNNSAIEVEEQTEIIPLNAEMLIKTINTEHYCGDNSTSNLGLIMYRYSTGDFSTNDENTKILVIHNTDNVIGDNAGMSFNEVIRIIDNREDVESLQHLSAFNQSCTGSGAGAYIKTFDVDFPTVDKSLAHIYVGGSQYAWASIEDVKFTLRILSQRGENVMLMEEYFEGSELFTQDQVATCSTQSEYDYSYLSFDCIKNLYLETQGVQEKVNQRAQDLIKFFEF